jgi:hypothetical protein
MSEREPEKSESAGEESSDDDIHLGSEENPILTKYEPGFQRVFARGSLLRVSEDDDETLQVAFWSSKDSGIEVEEGGTATGYSLESEVMMTWDTAVRLRKLLDNYIDEHAPDRVKTAEIEE